MRVLKEFPLSPAIKVTVFSWNGKFIVKLESGNLEQVYKVPETDIGGLPELEAWIIQTSFRVAAERQFEAMDAMMDPLFD